MKEAVVVVVRRGRRFLAIKRGSRARRPGYWAPPSGALEPGEAQIDAVVRELREETGLRVRPLEKVWECPTDEGDFLLYWWLAEPQTTTLKLDRGEAAAARWVTAEEFLRLQPTFAGDRDFFAGQWPRLAVSRPPGAR